MASQTTIKPLSAVVETISESTEDRIFKRVFLSPAVAILLLLSIFPLLWSLGVSVTTCQRTALAARAEGTVGGLGSVLCVGNPAELSLRNYERIPTDGRLLTAIRNTLFYVAFGVALQYVIGLILATLLNQQFWGRRFFRLVFLLPMMLTPVAAGYVGRMMFDSGISPLAQFQRTISSFLTNLFGTQITISIPWITDPGVAPFTMVLIDSWQWIPFMTLLLLAGMQAIPDEIYEAARVDGANARQLFWRITFPILLPISLTAILIRGLEMFKIVDIINVVTGGGPGTSTESLVMYVYDTALSYGNYGYAAAMGYVLLVMVILFATIYLAISRRITRGTLGAGS